MQNNYAKLKTRVLKFPKASPPAYLSLDIQAKHLIINLLCPEIPESIETEVNRANLKPYELAVRAKGNSDYLYDLTELENGSTRKVYKTDLIASNTVASSSECVVIVCYLEFQN